MGPPVVLSTKKCTEGQRRAALDRRHHQLNLAHMPILWEEFDSMVEKGQCMGMQYSVVQEISGLKLIPPEVKYER